MRKILTLSVLLAGATALFSGCGHDGWLYEPGLLAIRFDQTVETEEKVEEIVARYRRAELLTAQIFDGAGAEGRVRVPEGHEWRFIEKFESEEEVILVSPVWFVPVGATGGG